MCHLNSTLWASQSFYLILFDSSLCVSLPVLSDSFVTPWTAAHQAPPSVGFSRQESWSGLPLPPPGALPHPEMEAGFLHCRPSLYPLRDLSSPWLLITGLLLCLYCARFLSKQTWPPQRSGNPAMTCFNIAVPSECKSVILKPSRIISQHPWKESSEGTWRSTGGLKNNFYLLIYFVLVKARIIEHANSRVYLKFLLLLLKIFINYGISHMEQVKRLKYLIASAESYSLSVSIWSIELLGSQEV